MEKVTSQLFFERPELLKKSYMKYIIVAGIVFLTFPLNNYLFDGKINSTIFSILFLIAGIFFILLGLGEFSKKFNRYIKISEEYFVFRADLSDFMFGSSIFYIQLLFPKESLDSINLTKITKM